VANRKDFSHLPENPVSREMVKNQSPRLTGAAFFWAGVQSDLPIAALLPHHSFDQATRLITAPCLAA
jgi:hypothetical protein